MLRLNFLGDIKIELDGEDISEVISSKAVAMLAILLTQNGKRCSRQELLGFLWPESTEDAAKYNLRYNLWQLKKLIKPEPSGEVFLMVTKDFCKINEKYDYHCDLCEILETDMEALSDIDQLEHLSSLFKGDFFENQYFSGCDEFEEMIIMQRYSLENKKQILLKKLIARYYEEGKREQCLTALIACEEMDPYDEGNAQRRLQILIEDGNYSDALKYYQLFYNRLARDIGVEPSPALKKLAGKIKNREVRDEAGISINTFGLPSVECYWMADVLRALLAEEGFQITTYLPSARVEDLTYIQYRLGACRSTPSMARVVDSFVMLISEICQSGKRLEIKIEEIENLDSISREVLELVQKKCGDKIVVK